MGIKGKSGGARPGAGRIPIKTEREIKEQLQKLCPQALEAIEEGLGEDVVFAKLHKVRLDNAWRIINKFVADKKAIEMSGKDGQPFTINIVGDYLAASGWANAASKGNSEGPDEVQGSGVAQKGKENINSVGKNSS